MQRTTATMIAGLILLGSAAAPAAAMSMSSHGAQASAVLSLHGPQPFRIGNAPPRMAVTHPQAFATKAHGALPQSRKSCFRQRLRQLLRLGHDLDLAEEEALLICG